MYIIGAVKGNKVMQVPPPRFRIPSKFRVLDAAVA